MKGKSKWGVTCITNIVSSMISIAYYQRVHIYVKTCIQNLMQ